MPSVRRWKFNSLRCKYCFVFSVTVFNMWHYRILFMLISCGSFVLTAAETSTNDVFLELNLPEKELSTKGLNYFKVNFNNETQLRGIRQPCQCIDEQCGCCSGNILQSFNINIRQHFCINMTYEREDLSLGVKMSFNDLVLVSSKVSGKNPPPICIPIPRVANIKFCGRFSNVYFIGRNVHACVAVETEWNNRTVFSYSFDCFRLGVNGVALLPPEAGGGLPHPEDQETDNIEEYDELLENQSTTPKITTTTRIKRTKRTKRPIQTTTVKA